VTLLLAVFILAVSSMAWAQEAKPQDAKGYSLAGQALPTALGVWNASALQNIASGRFTFGDPPATLKPMKITSPGNGSASGVVIIAGPAVLTDVSATITELKLRGGKVVLPAKNVTISYAAMRPDAEKAVTLRSFEFYYCFDLYAKPAASTVIPVWVKVTVPKDATAGVYEASLTLKASGKSWTVPVEVQVAAWRAPDPKDWVTRVDLVDSPESVARMYKTPLYSDAHFAKIEKSLQLMGQLGNKTCWIPLISGGMLRSNNTAEPEESMVRYAIKDGKVEMDFSRMDRYLDLYEKYCGEPISINFYVWHSSGIDIHPRKQPDTTKVKATTMTGIDGKTIEVRNFTPEADVFWKQVMDAVHKRILARKWSEKSIMLGLAMDVRPSQQFVDQMKKAAPYATWVLHAHDAAPAIMGVPVGYCDNFRGGSGYRQAGWTNPEMRTLFPYDNPRTFSPLPYWRYVIEVSMNSGFRGLGFIGADHWNMATKDAEGKPSSVRSLHWVGGQPTMQLNNYLPALFTAGPDGATPSVLYETIREGTQELEARIIIEKGLASGKLSAALAKQCSDHLVMRKFPIGVYDFPLLEKMDAFATSDWQQQLTLPVFNLAGKVEAEMKLAEAKK
ncbi:MAG: glycoside hydrolase domain-containing protein, partial [bacterium]